MRRPQFTLRALLVATLVLAEFLGGMAVQRKLDRPIILRRAPLNQSKLGATYHETVLLPDGTECEMLVKEP